MVTGLAEKDQQVFRALLALDCLCRALGVLMRESQTLSRNPGNVLGEWATDAGTKACLSLGQLQRSLIWEVALKARSKINAAAPSGSSTLPGSSASAMDLLGPSSGGTSPSQPPPLPAAMLIASSPSQASSLGTSPSASSLAGSASSSSLSRNAPQDSSNGILFIIVWCGHFLTLRLQKLWLSFTI